MFVVALTAFAPASAYAGTSRGVYSNWTLDRAGGSELSQFIYVKSDGGISPAVFFSQQFGFSSGIGGYIGVQNRLTRDNPRRVAIFSIWNNGRTGAARVGAAGAYGPQIAQPFGGEGVGYQTLISYNWRPGTWYQLQIRNVGAGGFGTTRWEGRILDTTTNRWTTIGTILLTYNTGTLNSHLVNWTENYIDDGNCSGNVAEVFFARPWTNLSVASSRAVSTVNRQASNNCPTARSTSPGVNYAQQYVVF